MMATAEEIFDSAWKVEPFASRQGTFRLDPPVLLEEKKTGKFFHASAVDVNGKYAGTVHLVERIRWWPAEEFEIWRQKVWSCSAKECQGSNGSHLCPGFCTRCGSSLEQMPLGIVALNTPCPNCEARCVLPEDNFCRACGAQLKGA